MKKAILILALCFLTGWACAVLVDDFESYEPGTLASVTGGNWATSPVPTAGTPLAESIAADPTDSTNNVLDITTNGSAPIGAYGLLAGDEIVTNGTIKTLKLRFYTSATTCDTSFGLTTVDTPNQFGNFLVQCFINKGNFGARNLATNTTLTTWTANTWYYVWIVIDNSANTYDVYLKNIPSDATVADRKADNFAFRTIGTNNPDGDLDRFYAIGNYGTGVTGGTRELFDDMHVVAGEDLTIAPMVKPYSPSVAQGTPVGTSIPTTLSWKAGTDPAGVYAVNPDIVAQYVFVRSDLEPNLVYKGQVGDPGTTDPASQFTGFTGTVDRTYYWAVIEAISGYAHNGTDNPLLTVNSSVLGDVDPNNIFGMTWSYTATKSIPLIVTEPADTRVFPTGHPTADPNAVFTVAFTSVNTPTITWYKNGVAIVPNGTKWIVNNTSTSSQLVIDDPALTDEGKYYCVLTVTGSGSTTTATRLLVIKQELAKFDFENNLDDSSANAAPSGIMKTVSLADPNELLATVVASPFYDPAGIDGSAISLDGTQFVDFGTEGYPKAGPLDTIGDIRGITWEKKGFGRGMDEGSILCWVKLASDGVIYLNANSNTAPGTDDTHFAVSTNGTTNARIIIRGENADVDGTAQNLAEANGAYQMDQFDLKDGQWHMFAATWKDSTARVYVNGEEVANNTQGYTEVYRAWERGNLLGTSRTLTRHILNANDFVTGSIDKLRVYNYAIPAAEIEAEYEAETGNAICHNQAFEGVVANLDDTAGSYCVINLDDFMVIASNWLQDGF